MSQNGETQIILPKAFAAVDPGYAGYIAVLDADGRYLHHFKTPIGQSSKSIKKRHSGKIVTKTKSWLDIPAIREIFVDLKAQYNIQIVVVEKQHPMTGQGLASTGKTMEGYGIWQGLLAGLDIPYYLTSAVEWQKVTSDPKVKDKKAASVLSVKNWNKDIDLKKTKRSRIDDHNLADAICIARFAWHKFGSNGEAHVQEK